LVVKSPAQQAAETLPAPKAGSRASRRAGNSSIHSRLLIVHETARCGFTVPAEQVVIGKPPAFGLSGLQGVLIDNDLLNQTQAAGRTEAGGGGAGGGTGVRVGSSPP
jgi:hypothetical protein